MSQPSEIQNRKIVQAHRSSFNSITEIDESSLMHIDTNEPLHFADGNEPPQSIATRIGVEWNESGILIYFRGRYEQLRLAPIDVKNIPNSKTHKLWELSDVYEVFIGVNASETKIYKEFQVAPDSRWIDIDVNKQLGISNHFWHSGFIARSFVDKEMQIWTSIFELPWNCFGLNKKYEDKWNVNFYRASGKFHGDELLAWSATGYGEKCFHRPEHFGTIEFIK